MLNNHSINHYSDKTFNRENDSLIFASAGKIGGGHKQSDLELLTNSQFSQAQTTGKKDDNNL